MSSRIRVSPIEPFSNCAVTLGDEVWAGAAGIGHYDVRMRYLADSFALGALRRRKAIAQFLGASRAEDRRVMISWVEVYPIKDGFAVVLHVAEDVGGEHFADLWEFPPADPDDEFGRQIGRADDAVAAMSLAEELTSAVRGRWVNLGVVQDEYLDYVRRERESSR